ncbi:MAG: serine hydrolase [Defluviitaleaceae bacterium]|nr:serine hydrolase [Defluviitaleaceae bacterium]
MSEKKMMFTIFMLTLIIVAIFAFFLFIFVQAGGAEERVPATHRHIHSNFTVYSQPSFFSDIITQHRSQMVKILEEQTDGWMHIAFADIEGWVYLSSHQHTLERPVGLFHNKDDAMHTDLIGPGEVQVLEEDGHWLLVATPSTPMWLNLHFWPSAEQLDDFLYGLPFNVSVYYRNLATGFTFSRKGDLIYNSASLNKTPFALYVYHLAETGLIDLSQTHTYTTRDHRFGTGVIRNMPFGTQLTTAELLTHSVRDSDNVAHHMLMGLFANQSPSYREFYASIGGNVGLIDIATGRQNLMSAEEAGLIMYRIHQYIENDTSYAANFKYSLLNSDIPIITADHPIAQKYGRWDGNFHDKAIVYAPSPYILVIMSTLDQNNQGAFEEFAEISRFFQDFNNRYFTPQ